MHINYRAVLSSLRILTRDGLSFIAHLWLAEVADLPRGLPSTYVLYHLEQYILVKLISYQPANSFFLRI